MLITDICPDEETAAALDRFQKDAPACKVFLFDHHKTSSWVDQYSWARHDADHCGTVLYYDWLLEKGGFTRYDAVDAKDFAELVDVYDRWLLDHPRRQEIS